MQQGIITQMINQESLAYVALLTVQRQIGITRGTLKKYLTYLNYAFISQEAMEIVRHLKENPTLPHLSSSQEHLTEREEGKTLGFDRGKDTSNGI